jgi:outer membrane lipoprotein-sorting protein
MKWHFAVTMVFVLLSCCAIPCFAEDVPSDSVPAAVASESAVSSAAGSESVVSSVASESAVSSVAGSESVVSSSASIKRPNE